MSAYRSFERVRRVGIVATGMVGAGWAAYFLSRGLGVSAYGRRAAAEQELRDYVSSAWDDLTRIGAAKGSVPNTLTYSTDLATAIAGCDFIQENAAENEALKIDLYAQVDAIVPRDVLIASSTSSLSITSLQSKCKHPERCVLGHPFTPTHLLPLVEVVGGAKTDPAAVDAAIAFYAGHGKRPVRLNREVFGHIANRLASALFREAVNLAVEGVATAEEIDAAVVNGPGRKWAITGPFLSYHLTGGAGGFGQFLEHFGKGMERRWADLGAPSLTPDVRKTLTDQVTRSYGDLREQNAARADKLVALTKAIGTTAK